MVMGDVAKASKYLRLKLSQRAALIPGARTRYDSHVRTFWLGAYPVVIPNCTRGHRFGLNGLHFELKSISVSNS